MYGKKLESAEAKALRAKRYKLICGTSRSSPLEERRQCSGVYWCGEAVQQEQGTLVGLRTRRLPCAQGRVSLIHNPFLNGQPV